ncbi:MAG: 3-hydroxybutyryl-CoA dehydrogenase [Dehalococcoidales bacterium]|nr:3-hydroxybutyryl-CoA dehydrogenase [Dehalococcoidales bacterium]
MEIKKVGVVGCGAMGAGIVQVCAQAGFQVVASEINDALLKRGLGLIDTLLSKDVSKQKITQADKEAIQARIKGTTDMKDFVECDLVIEAVIESMELKRKVFGDLDKICPPHAILASNSSSLSILDMAIATKRLDKVLGIHFFNPVPVMKLVELIRTIATSDETADAGRQFAEKVGKTVVAAKDTPGFIVNYLMIPQLLNAVRILEKGVAAKEDIDNAMKLGLNHPLGPFALIDLVGVDVVCFIAKAVYEETKDPQFIIPTLLQKMFTAGWLGRKSGKGFYDYQKS